MIIFKTEKKGNIFSLEQKGKKFFVIVNKNKTNFGFNEIEFAISYLNETLKEFGVRERFC